MKEYVFKRGVISLIWSLILAIGGAGFVFFISWIFTEEIEALNFILSGATLFLLGFSAIFGENISITINGNNLKYTKRNKVIHDLDLTEYASGYKTRHSDGTADDLRLILAPIGGGEEINIDCTPIGTNKFHKMYGIVENLTGKESAAEMKIVKKKGKK